MVSISPRLVFSFIKNEEKILDIRDQCVRDKDRDCARAAYRRLLELVPNSVSYSANLAFELTRAKMYAEADPIYSQILKSGHGTYDLMAFYGRNLDALDRTDEAIGWYEKSLALSPNLVDITKTLAQAYVKSGRVVEAVSLLKSFANRYPEAEGLVSGDLAADIELLNSGESLPNETIQLVGVAKGNFALPISLKSGAKPEVFLVDTDASTVTIPTKDAEIHFPKQLRTAKQGIATLADGSKIKIHSILAPSLHIGKWTFTNVPIAYCNNCERLAGLSLLKNLKLEASSSGDFYTLKLTR